MKKVFVTGSDRTEHARQAIDDGTALMCLGYLPFMPPLGFIPPSRHTYYKYLRGWLANCDAVFCRQRDEHMIVSEARRLGIPVFDNLVNLFEELPPE